MVSYEVRAVLPIFVGIGQPLYVHVRTHGEVSVSVGAELPLGYCCMGRSLRFLSLSRLL